MFAPWKKSYDKPRQCIKKQRHYFANKGPYSQSYGFSMEGLRLKLKLQYFGHLIRRTDSSEKTLMLGKIEGGGRRGKQDEMVGWHHLLDGHEFGWTLGVGDGQGGLACLHGVAKSCK